MTSFDCSFLQSLDSSLTTYSMAIWYKRCSIPLQSLMPVITCKIPPTRQLQSKLSKPSSPLRLLGSSCFFVPYLSDIVRGTERSKDFQRQPLVGSTMSLTSLGYYVKVGLQRRYSVCSCLKMKDACQVFRDVTQSLQRWRPKNMKLCKAAHSIRTERCIPGSKETLNRQVSQQRHLQKERGSLISKSCGLV